MTVEQIAQWMADYLTQHLKIRPDQVDRALCFDDYGIDSKTAGALVGDLSHWLQQDLELAIVYDYPSIEQLSHHLAEVVKEPTHGQT